VGGQIYITAIRQQKANIPVYDWVLRSSSWFIHLHILTTTSYLL